MNLNDDEELDEDQFQPIEFSADVQEISEQLRDWCRRDDCDRLRAYRRLVARNRSLCNGGTWNSKKTCGFMSCPFPHYDNHRLPPSPSATSDAAGAGVKGNNIGTVTPAKQSGQKTGNKVDASTTKRTKGIGQKASKDRVQNANEEERVLIVQPDRFRKPTKEQIKSQKDTQTRFANRENATPYKHGAPIEQVLKEYREANMYSRARLTKVNKKEVASAIMSVRPPHSTTHHEPAADANESDLFTRLSQDRSRVDRSVVAETGRREDRSAVHQVPMQTTQDLSQSRPFIQVSSLLFPQRQLKTPPHQQRSKFTTLKETRFVAPPRRDSPDSSSLTSLSLSGHDRSREKMSSFTRRLENPANSPINTEVPKTIHELLEDEQNKIIEARLKQTQQTKYTTREVELTPSEKQLVKDAAGRLNRNSFLRTNSKTRVEEQRSFSQTHKTKTIIDMQPMVVQLKDGSRRPDRQDFLASSLNQECIAERPNVYSAINREIYIKYTTKPSVTNVGNSAAEKVRASIGNKAEPKHRITLDFDEQNARGNSRRVPDGSTRDGAHQRKVKRNPKKKPLKQESSVTMGNLFLSGVPIKAVEHVRSFTQSRIKDNKGKRISPNVLGFKITNDSLLTEVDNVHTLKPCLEELSLPLHECETNESSPKISTQTYEVTQILSPQFGPDDQPLSDNEVIIRGYLGLMEDPRDDFDIVIDPETFDSLSSPKKKEILRMAENANKTDTYSGSRYFDGASQYGQHDEVPINHSQSLPVTRVPEEMHLDELFAKTKVLQNKLQSDPLLAVVGDHLKYNGANESRRQMAGVKCNNRSYRDRKKSAKISSYDGQGRWSRAERDACPNPDEVADLLDRLNIDGESCLASKTQVTRTNPESIKNATKTANFYSRALKSSYLQKYEGASMERLRTRHDADMQNLSDFGGQPDDEAHHLNSPAGGDAPREGSKSSMVSCGTDPFMEETGDKHKETDLNYSFNRTGVVAKNNFSDDLILDTKYPKKIIASPDSPKEVTQSKRDEAMEKTTYSPTKIVRFKETQITKLDGKGTAVKKSRAMTNLSDNSDVNIGFTSQTEFEKHSANNSGRKKHKHFNSSFGDSNKLDRKFSHSTRSERIPGTTTLLSLKRSAKLDLTPNKDLADEIASDGNLPRRAVRDGLLPRELITNTNSYIDAVSMTKFSKSASNKSSRNETTTEENVKRRGFSSAYAATSQATNETSSQQYSELTKGYADLLLKLKHVNGVNKGYKPKKRL